MVNEQLKAYIQSSRTSHVDEQTIRQNLLNAGWAAADVDYALTYTGESPVPVPPSPSSINTNVQTAVTQKKSNSSGKGCIIAAVVGIGCFMLLAIVGIFASIVLVAINPSKQIASARDTQRKADLTAIGYALSGYEHEHIGDLTKIIPDTKTHIGTKTGLINLKELVVPKYMVSMPKDPASGTDSDTEYSIFIDEFGKIVLSSTSEVNPNTEIVVIR